MARVNRSSVLLWLQDALGIQSGANPVPVDTPNSIQPVIDVFPRRTSVVRAVSSTASTSTGTIYTTPSDKDFYLTYACLGITKDATSDNVLTRLSFVQDGKETNLLAVDSQTTTAGSFFQNISLSHPIKVDRGTNINMPGTFTAGTMTKRCSIGGFILE